MHLDYQRRKQAAYVWIWIALGCFGLGVVCFLFTLMCQAIPAVGDEYSYAVIFKSFGECFVGPLSGTGTSIESALTGVSIVLAAIMSIACLIFSLNKKVIVSAVGAAVGFPSAAALAFSCFALHITGKVGGERGTATILLVGMIALFLLALLCNGVAVFYGFIFNRFASLQVQADLDDDETEVEASNDEAESEDEDDLDFQSDEDEEEFDVNEERLRQIIREELAALKLTPTNIYVTVPPEGAKPARPAPQPAQPKPQPAPAPAPEPTPAPQPVVEPEEQEEEPLVAAPEEEPIEEETTPEPVVEEAAPLEEEEIVEEVAESDEEDDGEEKAAGNELGFPINENKRKVPFEEKLANADKDLVEKYEGLRDYIMSYGIKNRVSIPGDTFSAHRERYVFITITGKKLKVNFALDPKDYENDTIPITANPSKKFEDIPLTLKIKSGLSYRRALKLVDDVMAKKGITKVS